ncbi:MAG TPA: hypothetical protein VHE61_05650 [Opitutaceae bacterium]|nr:hypothetical protein [Opitutaceae bacterium]
MKPALKYISIVGSVSASRTYDPPIRNAAEAHATAESLGAQLARHGYGLTVYAGDFIERDVVRGYVRHATTDHAIRVLYASHQKGPAGFPEYAEHRNRFQPIVDHAPDWEVSYYGSLATADGLIVIGGGQASFIIGILALAHRIPMLALRTYGGSGEKIWTSMSRQGLATPAEIAEMGIEPDGELIGRWVDSLARQIDRRRRQMRRLSGTAWLVMAIVLVVAWILTLPIGHWLVTAKSVPAAARAFVFLLFLAPMLAGMSGSTIRMFIPDAGTPTLRTTMLGLAAGAICGVLYVTSQLAANPDPHQLIVLATAVAFGFIAGLTFDTVFRKLQQQDPIPSKPLADPVHG